MSRTKIKICGLFRDCDIAYVNESQPDYAGFVFYPPSHRYVTKKQMIQFRERLLPQILAVGVFVDAPIESVAKYLTEGILQVVQLHGHEDETYIEQLRTFVPNGEIWKAFQISQSSDLQAAVKSSADRILLDNGYGTGKCFDWKLIQGQEIPRPFFLAGGLRLENIEEAIERFRPWGVDISSGVETNKRKDKEKIRQIIGSIRRK